MAAAKLLFVALSALSALTVASLEDEAGNPAPVTSQQVVDLLDR